MRNADLPIFNKLEKQLMGFHHANVPLPGIIPMGNRIAFIRQVIDSLRRIKYVEVIRNQSLSVSRADPASDQFDPLKAAILAERGGDLEEACWLVFLATHFGINLKTGWRLTSEVYGALGGAPWTWNKVRNDVTPFRKWMENNYQGLTGNFGNHRKYESLKPTDKGPAAVVGSYRNWVMTVGSHKKLFAEAAKFGGHNPRQAFAYLYQSMGAVRRFGRTGKFDYLTMLSKLQFAPIEADATYMSGATGPARGARLLFAGDIQSGTSVKILEKNLQSLENQLKCGMQVLEDSLCNWQKSPNEYQAFRG